MMTDFANEKILVMSGSAGQFDTEKRKSSTACITYFDGSEAEMVNKLLDRTIDAVAEGDICAHYLATTRYLDQLTVVDVHPVSDLEHFTFVVRETSGDLLNVLNAFILEYHSRY